MKNTREQEQEQERQQGQEKEQHFATQLGRIVINLWQKQHSHKKGARNVNVQRTERRLNNDKLILRQKVFICTSAELALSVG